MQLSKNNLIAEGHLQASFKNSTTSVALHRIVSDAGGWSIAAGDPVGHDTRAINVVPSNQHNTSGRTDGKWS